MTLLEVVVGIALLATLLVSTLVAYRGHANQIRSAHTRISAVQLADELLHQWIHEGAMPAAGSHGVLPGDDGFSWQILAVRTPRERKLPIELMRLEIYDSKNIASTAPLVSVELFTAGEFLAP